VVGFGDETACAIETTVPERARDAALASRLS